MLALNLKSINNLSMLFLSQLSIFLIRVKINIWKSFCSYTQSQCHKFWGIYVKKEWSKYWRMRYIIYLY